MINHRLAAYQLVYNSLPTTFHKQCHLFYVRIFLIFILILLLCSTWFWKF